MKANYPIPPEVEKVISVYRQVPGGSSLGDGAVEQAIQSKVAGIAELIASNEKAFPSSGVDILASPGFQRQDQSELMQRFWDLGVG